MPPVTLLRDAIQQRGSAAAGAESKVVFDQSLSSKDKAFLVAGLSSDGTTLSLNGYEYGTSPDLDTIEPFLRNNSHITHFEWRGAELSQADIDTIAKIPSLKSFDNPGTSEMSRKSFKR